MSRTANGGALLGAVLALSVLFPGSPAADPPPEVPRIVPGEVLVLGRASSLAPGAGAGRLSPSGATVPVLPPEAALRRSLDRGGIPMRGARLLGRGRSGGAAFPGGAWVVELEEGADVYAAAALLAEDPDVSYAGPNHVLSLGIGETTEPFEAEAPVAAETDPLVESQWALADARVPEAWERSRGEGVLVAVIDTGLDLDHPDLAPQIAVNEAERDGIPGVDDDGNGYVDDVLGYDFVDAPALPGAGDWRDRDPDPTDDLGHGTQVAGVLLAEEGSGFGIAGVAPGAKIIPVRAGFRTRLPFQSGLLEEDDIAAAILYAVDRGARILNLSFGDGTDAPVLREAIRYAQGHGVLVVASAGNNREDAVAYPAATLGVLVAGASTFEGERAGFSSYGQDLDLLAPGLNVLTTHLDGTHRGSSGTSFSAPMVAGTAALLWSLHPDWTPQEVAWGIRLAARRTRRGWEPDTGWGFLDAAAAVATEGRPPTIGVERIPPPAEGEDSLAIRGTVVAPDLLSWTLSVAPESLAVGWGSGEGIPGELVLATSYEQVGADVLAEFRPPPGGPRMWVSRLVARRRGREPIEERARFVAPPAGTRYSNLVVEPRAGGSGWSLAVTWNTPDIAQGAVRLGSGTPEPMAEAVNLSRTHGVILPGPLPAGTWPLEILVRGTEGGAYTALAETLVVVPGEATAFRLASIADLPAGSPMARTVDWDGDSLPEVLLEVPSTSQFYGPVHRYEVDPSGNTTHLGSSAFNGYPVDAGDLDGDGLPELVTFRLFEGWFVYESFVAGQFPRVFVGSHPDGVPWRFVETEGGPRLLTVDGSRLLSWRAGEDGTYVTAAEASSPLGDLRTRGAWGDVDGDGGSEAVLVDQEGRLVLFEVDSDEIRYRTTVDPPAPLAGPLVTVPVGRRDDLVSVEQDEFGADPAPVEATRLRRWTWSGSTLVPVAELVFTGIQSESDLEILPAGPDRLLLRRFRRVDAVSTEAGGLGWAGSLGETALDPLSGMVVVENPLLLWLGSTSTALPFGEGWRLEGETVPLLSGALDIVEARPLGNAVEVTLAWPPSSCGLPVSLERESSLRGLGAVPTGDRTARDTLQTGEEVTYRLTEAGCSTRQRSFVGRLPTSWAPRWEGPGLLVVDLERPLGAPPGAVWVDSGGRSFRPAAVQWDRSGSRLVLPLGTDDVPDSLEILDAREEDGYPLGGSIRTVRPVPPAPNPLSPPVLAEVTYQGAAPGPLLRVRLGGGDLADTCAVFTLDPGGQVLSGGVRTGEEIVLDLAQPLAAGTYTLRLAAACVGAGGGERGFRVGAVFYPNPIRGAAELTVEGLPVGASVRIFDARGEERMSWQVEGPAEVRPVDLPPGLYFVRFEGVGASGIEKLVVLR